MGNCATSSKKHAGPGPGGKPINSSSSKPGFTDLNFDNISAGLSVHLTGGPLTAKDYRERLTASEGTQTISLPNTGYTVRYAYVSQRGYYPDNPGKPNQDTLCAVPAFAGDKDQAFFGVFDGHGEFGSAIAAFARDKIAEGLISNTHFAVAPEIAYHQAMVAANSQLHRSEIDDCMSGTTAVTVLVRGRTVHVANVGDSRAVLAERQGDRFAAVDLSYDQTPYRRDEAERVKRCGARVLTLDQLEGLKDPTTECWGNEGEEEGDPPRVWAANATYPGTAFTRSIGDSTAERIGVFAEPEVVTKQLTANHPFLVIASDGVFEFLPSQSVIDMVSKFDDPQEACLSVVAESYRLWLMHETRTDDITMIVIQFQGLQDEAPQTATPTPVGAPWDYTSRPTPSLSGMALRRMPSARLPAIEATTHSSDEDLRPSDVSLHHSLSSPSTTEQHSLPLPLPSHHSSSSSAHHQNPTTRSPILHSNSSPHLPPSSHPSPKPPLHPPTHSSPHIPIPIPIHLHQPTFARNSFNPQHSESTSLEHPHSVRKGSASVSEGVAGVERNNSGLGPGVRSIEFRMPAPFKLLEAAATRDLLFSSMDESQRRQVYVMFDHRRVLSGEVIIRQGEQGDHFFVVESGQFDVILQIDQQQPTLVHTYCTVGAHVDSFGELALLYRKPRAATVVARTDGVLWSLSRCAFKHVMHRLFAPHYVWRKLRGVEALSVLSVSQLQIVAEAMEEVCFSDEQFIIHQGEDGVTFHVIDAGEVSCTVRKDPSDEAEVPKEVLTLNAGQYFGEKALMVTVKRAANVIANGAVVLLRISRSTLESLLGPLQSLSEAHDVWVRQVAMQREVLSRKNTLAGSMVQGNFSLEDLEPRGLIFATECSALMVMEHTASEDVYSVRVTSVADAMETGKQALVLRARDITRSLEPSFFVPGVLTYFKDERVLAEVLMTVGLCTLDCLMQPLPFDEASAMFIAASVILGLEHLHWSGVLYRGLSVHSIIITGGGQVQLVDFRFARKNEGRAFTLCGNPEYLAPEVIESRGHTEAADFWSLGVLIYCLMTGETPFTAEDADELRIYRRIVTCSYTIPATLSPAAAHLINSLLQPIPSDRLGMGPGGLRALKNHPWFAAMNWDALMEHKFQTPPGIRERIYNFEAPPCTQFKPQPAEGDLMWIHGF